MSDSPSGSVYIFCMPIDITETTNANETKIELIGTIDEKAFIPFYPDVSILRIDFGRVSNINSVGVRNFLVWGEKHVHLKSIRLENCPAIFVKNFSSITGFLKPNMTVMSFFTPYYSEETQETVEIHLVKGRDFNYDGMLNLPPVKDSQGNTMEMDVIDSYFAFLQK